MSVPSVPSVPSAPSVPSPARIVAHALSQAFDFSRVKGMRVLCLPWSRCETPEGWTYRVFGEWSALCSVRLERGFRGAAPALFRPIVAVMAGCEPFSSTLLASSWEPAGLSECSGLLAAFVRAVSFSTHPSKSVEEVCQEWSAWCASGSGDDPMPASLSSIVATSPPLACNPLRPVFGTGRNQPMLLDSELVRRVSPGCAGLSVVFVVQVNAERCQMLLYKALPHKSATNPDVVCRRKVVEDDSGRMRCSMCGDLDRSMVTPVSMWMCRVLVSSQCQAERDMDRCVEVMMFEAAATQLFGWSGEEFANAARLSKLALLASVEERRVCIDWKITMSSRRGVHEKQVIANKVYTAPQSLSAAPMAQSPQPSVAKAEAATTTAVQSSR